MRTLLLYFAITATLLLANRAEAATSISFSVHSPTVHVGYGHYELREEVVLIEPERVEQVWIPARYAYRTDENGNTIKILVQRGYYKEVISPAKYETRLVKVWIQPRHVVVDYSPCFSFSWSHHRHRR